GRRGCRPGRRRSRREREEGEHEHCGCVGVGAGSDGETRAPLHALRTADPRRRASPLPTHDAVGPPGERGLLRLPGDVRCHRFYDEIAEHYDFEFPDDPVAFRRECWRWHVYTARAARAAESEVTT